MTSPCGHEDLPMPFEPIVNYNGVPTVEYSFPDYDINPAMYYDVAECLRLNDGYIEGRMDPIAQQYFYGEVIPPYIDVLGRGPHFRMVNSVFELKYQSTVRCYVNYQRYGSPVFQRLVDYYGPQYDIQFGKDHQGYAALDDDGQSYYSSFFGSGSLYIDLPRARKFEPSFNCTRGIRIMNETRTVYNSVGVGQTVYTSALFDETGVSRQILKGEDQLYPGTCEADVICYDAVASSVDPEAISCPEGYVCDEGTSSDKAFDYPCRAGYYCDYGTTPDPSVSSPTGQFRKLCPPGFVCMDATGKGQAYRTLCPVNYYCPAGTGDNVLGTIAGDAINRGLSAIDANPYYDRKYVRYIENDDVRVLSKHDLNCLDGIDQDLSLRYDVVWQGERSNQNNPFIRYLIEYTNNKSVPYTNDPLVTGQALNDTGYYRPATYNSANLRDSLCGRDHKWRLIDQVIRRQECDCVTFFKVVVAVYRFWKCTSSADEMIDLGLASLASPYNGNRDFWFPRTKHSGTVCDFSEAYDGGNVLDPLYGRIVFDDMRPSVGPNENLNDLLSMDPAHGLEMQFIWEERRTWYSYADLKTDVMEEYNLQVADLQSLNPTRTATDPYIFNLYNAIMLIEVHGELLEEHVSVVKGTNFLGDETLVPGRSDMCEW